MRGATQERLEDAAEAKVVAAREEEQLRAGPVGRRTGIIFARTHFSMGGDAAAPREASRVGATALLARAFAGLPHLGCGWAARH